MSARTEMLRIRVTPQEKARIEKEAGSRQVSAFVRRRVLGETTPVYVGEAELARPDREEQIRERMAKDKPAFSQQEKRRRAIAALEDAGLI